MNADAATEAALTRIWSEVLEIPVSSIDADANFFALGGDSVLMARVADRVVSHFFSGNPDDAPGIAEYFACGTIRSFAARLQSPERSQNSPVVRETNAAEVAIIGMSCRFPDAASIDAFWRNLCAGVESVRTFTDEELLASGVPAADLRNPTYVKAGVVLDGAHSFDADYFGMTGREATLTSPEQRLLIECAEEAFQDAGYADRDRARPVGVFTGTGFSSYLLEVIEAQTFDLESSQGMALFAANTCAASRVAYLLDLTGPAVTIDTACSSSLVAVHEACRSLLRGECEMALAGGATVRRAAPRGYIAEPGGIFSPDGHCRPFDARANGTVGSSGAGMVLLKRLSNAIADGDSIYAVIRGTAVNNDGRAKAGYTAPSSEGQAAVIRAALTAARCHPRTVQYVETHGTATAVGDVIELSALREVFAADQPAFRKPVIGAVKANLGHLEAAAGIAGLIKTALVLKHGQIPPAIHFEKWATALGDPSFEMYPRLTALPASDAPRRAGISSFGIGGTNAHAVLEEPPLIAAATDSRAPELLVISARTDSALRESCRRLVAYLKKESSGTLAEIAYTLQVGRKHFDRRAYVVASSKTEAAELLDSAVATTGSVLESRRTVPGSEHLHELGQAWVRGATVNWRELNASRPGRRISLPTYPFERSEHWVQARSPEPRRAAPKPDRLDLADWFNAALWEQKPVLHGPPNASAYSGCCLLLGAWRELESAVRTLMARFGNRLVCVSTDRCDSSSIPQLLETLKLEGTPVTSVIHCAEGIGVRDVSVLPDDTSMASLHTLIALSTLPASLRSFLKSVVVVTCAGHKLADESAVSPVRAMLATAAQVLAREFPQACCRTIDTATDSALDLLIAEIFSDCTDPLVAIRGGRRWARTYRKQALPKVTEERSLLRDGGAYLITGGMGGIGWTLARFLARERRARLILTGRSAVPMDPDRLREIHSLEAAGARVLVTSADVSSLEDMRRVVALGIREFGGLNGVIHAAGIAGHATAVGEVLAPKVLGTWTVHEACRSQQLDFFACCSSVSAAIAPEGWYAYAVANAFQDAFCEANDGRAGTRFMSIGWDSWKSVGFAERAGLSPHSPAMAHAITPDEGIEVFRRALENPAARWIISTRDLNERLRTGDSSWAQLRATIADMPKITQVSDTRSLATIQSELGLIWAKLLGVDSVKTADDFFARGGDSLSLVQLGSEIEERFGRSPPLQELTAAATLGAMAQLLRGTA